jgi:excisionase family DNA binding protein
LTQTGKLLTVNETADRMGVSERMIRRLIEERRIAYSKIGKHIRIAEADIDAYLEAARVEAVETAVAR